MDRFAGTGSLDRGQQFLLDAPIVSELVFGHMDDHDADLELGEMLIVFQAAVDCH